jgi:hypothetical protein
VTRTIADLARRVAKGAAYVTVVDLRRTLRDAAAGIRWSSFGESAEEAWS